MNRREAGIRGEELARDFLEQRGYHVIETNYRCPEGEIDIVARHRDFLVFVEVRAKTSREFGLPEESITSAEKDRLRATAYRYRQINDDLPPLWRIDVVAVELDHSGQPLRLEIIESAVGGD